METIGEYVMVESIDEIADIRHYDCGDGIYTDAFGMFHEARKVTYPHVFKRHNNFGPLHPNGYYPCEKDDMIQKVRCRIDALQYDVDYYNKMLSKLEHIE